jgi:protein-disulfide isomerase
MTNARTARQQKVATLREAERRRGRARRRLVMIAAVAGVLLIAVGTTIGVGLGSGSTSESASGPVVAPAGVSPPSGPIVVGKASAPNTIDLYEDFQCPVCHEFENTNRATVEQAVAAGRAKVNYHIMSFIGTESVRAANAAGCAQDAGRFLAFHDYLYDHQPKEDSGGYTSADLVAAGAAIGLKTPAFRQCVAAMTHQSWVSASNNAGLDVTNGTPYVVVNGTPVSNWNDPTVLQQTLTAAR